METILVDLPQFKQMHERIKELEAALRACIGCATLPDPLAARNAVIATVKLVLGDQT